MASSTMFYDAAFQTVDYCGDIKSGKGSYSSDFSPNNIRRFIISPDGVRSELYLPHNGKRTFTVNIPSAMYDSVSSRPDYKPMVSVLGTDRICSSVEEVVFLVTGSNGAYLNSSEYDFASLIANLRSKSSNDLLKVIKQRFVRLRAFTVIEGITLKQFLTFKRGADTMVYEMPEVQGHVTVNKVHDEDDWYRNYGSPVAARTYPEMDGANGKLSLFFKDYIAKTDADKKAQSVQKFKEANLESRKKDFLAEFAKLRQLSRVRALMINIWKANEKTVDGIDFTPDFGSFPELYDLDIGGYAPKKDLGDTSKMEAYRLNTIAVKEALPKVMNALVNSYFSGMYDLYKKYPKTYKVLGDDVFKYIIVPAESKKIADELGYSCSSGNALSSYVTCCNMICRNLMRHDGEKFDRKCISTDFWKEAISK